MFCLYDGKRWDLGLGALLFRNYCLWWSFFLWLCLQEPDKPVTFQVDSEETDLKEYSDYLKLEESILEHMGL